MADIRDFTLPDLGEGLEDGELVSWHVEVGDHVGLNDPIAEVETAKAVVDVPSPFAGRVVERIGDVGDVVPVGAVLVRIDVAVGADTEVAAAPGGGDDAADVDPGPATDPVPRSTGLDADEEPQPLVGYGQAAGGRRRRRRGPVDGAASEGAAAEGAAPEGTPEAAPAPVLAKPPVRKLATDLGVDLAALAPGAGPDGSITRAEVEAAAATATGHGEPAGSSAPAAGPLPDAPAAATAASTAPAPPAVVGFRGRRPGEVEQIRGIRRRIVEKMETSRREIPSATCSRDADLTALWELRDVLTGQANDEGHDVRITPFALICRAVVVALRRFPTLNARIHREADGGRIELLEPIHLGVAADTDRGLVVPVITDAHARSTLELARELERLADAARDGTLTPAELTGGTFTVNNYGAFGNDDGDPIINHPEAAILGVGAIRERPWVVHDTDGRPELAIRRVGRFTLAFDHRICDGGEAGRFVTEVATLCEQPGRLLLHQ
ncbi:MAG: dihydrolipoamide acetyltransferase family protein [Nitriliruptoraceae bacterium]